MRTSQKNIARLLSEVRRAIGKKTISETWQFIHYQSQQIKAHLEAKYDISFHYITPYADTSWKLCGTDNKDCPKGTVRCPSMRVTAEMLATTPAIDLAEAYAAGCHLVPRKAAA